MVDFWTTPILFGDCSRPSLPRFEHLKFFHVNVFTISNLSLSPKHIHANIYYKIN